MLENASRKQNEGRKRGERGKAEVEKVALAVDAVQRALDGAVPKKIIVVPGRIVNVVI